MEIKSKTDAVLNYLLENGEIDNSIAVEKFGAYRLSAIILNLRKKNYPIITNMIETVDRYGRPIKYAKYTLENI